MSCLDNAAFRIFTFFRDARRTNEAWSAGESDYQPSNADVIEYFEKRNAMTFASEAELCIPIVKQIIAQEMEKIRDSLTLGTSEHGVT